MLLQYDQYVYMKLKSNFISAYTEPQWHEPAGWVPMVLAE